MAMHTKKGSDAEARGRTFVYRVGPPFMRARLGQDVRAPLTAREVEAVRLPGGACGQGAAKPEAAGGLVVVGSHVALTTRQLERLVADTGAPVLEIEVGRILDAASRDDHLEAVIDRAVQLLDRARSSCAPRAPWSRA